jgi:methylenetetrahydrofolate reductase (NADPH)
MTLAYGPTHAPMSVRALLDNYSMEMTGKDVGALSEAAAAGAIPAGTRIHVTYLATEDLETRLAAAGRVRELGFVPVPHISARRLADEDALRGFLGALRSIDASDTVFVVGGDPPEAEGPFSDALSVIRTGLLEEFGVSSVGISGYPEGHPDIADDVLWQALEEKSAELAARGLDATIVTQFCFDAEPVLDWMAAVRKRGITTPIRIGVPGPAGVKRLLAYARRFGVGTSTEVVRKYGLSLTNLLGTAGPDKFLHALAAGHDPGRHGDLELHFYAFGGLEQTADWVRACRADEDGHR